MGDEEPKNEAGKKPSKGKVFLHRLTSTLILWGVVLGGLFCGNATIASGVFLVVMLTLVVSGQLEFYNIAKSKGLPCYRGLGVWAGAILFFATWLHSAGLLGIHDQPSRVNDFETILVIAFVLGLCVRQFMNKDNSQGIVTMAVTLFGIMYVAWLLNFVQKIYFFQHDQVEGAYYVVYFIVVTKFSDMGAYLVGSMIGKHKMIPRVSPGKTWEGFGGAIVISTGGSLLFAHLFRDHMVGMTPMHAIIIGVMLSVAAVIGDLIESLMKREAGVKDSGNYFPGIGGILDLLDSLLFNAPLMYLYLRHVLTS
ncbi:MAG: phosphatidate cytidylyltransferase [Limisphaerales bacterium]